MLNMNYVYDVSLNFQYPLYDFYEWNNEDFIVGIRKIPIYKVSSKSLLEMRLSKFKIDNVKILKNKTKTYNTHKNYLSFICTDGHDVLAFNFDSNGLVIGKSSILPEEAMEILEGSTHLNQNDIIYRIIRFDKISNYKTRYENMVSKYLINMIKKTNDQDKLSYISFECFNQNLESKNLIELIRNKWDDKYIKIYDFFKANSMNKN